MSGSTTFNHLRGGWFKNKIMKWNYKKPTHGDERIIKRFLLFPRYVNGSAKWLCVAKIKQYYEGQNWADDGWHSIEFI